jgi:hypothetical protein
VKAADNGYMDILLKGVLGDVTQKSNHAHKMRGPDIPHCCLQLVRKLNNVLSNVHDGYFSGGLETKFSTSGGSKTKTCLPEAQYSWITGTTKKSQIWVATTKTYPRRTIPLLPMGLHSCISA